MKPYHHWTLPLVGLALVGASCGASESLWASAEAELEDLRLAVQARTVLGRDPALAPMNLGVRVQGGVATLWGPISSVDDLRHAVELLRGLTGVRDVRTDVYLASHEGVTGGKLFLPEDSRPTKSASASPDRDWGQLPAWGGEMRRLPSVKVAREGDPHGLPKSDFRKGTPTHPRPGLRSGPSVALLAPIAVPTDRPGPVPVSKPPSDTLLATLADLQQEDPRYGRIRIEVQKGVVSLVPSGVGDEWVMALARKASTVPGVRRVVVRQDDGR